MTGKIFLTLVGMGCGFILKISWLTGDPWSVGVVNPLLGGGLTYLAITLFSKISGKTFWPNFGAFAAALNDPKNLTRLIFIFFAALYLLTMSGHLNSADDSVRFRITKALVERGDLKIDLEAPPFYSKYGIVQPLLSVPLYLVGREIKNESVALLRKADELVVSTLNQWLGALLAAVFFLLLKELGYGSRSALPATMTLGLGTIFFPYARYFFTAPLTSLILLFALLQLLRFSRIGSARHLFLAGLAIALGGANSTVVFILAGPFAVLYILFCDQTKGPGSWVKKAGLRLTWFGLPIALAVAWVLYYNHLRYGSPWMSGYETNAGLPNLVYDGSPGFSTPLWVGLYGYLFSAGKGVFFYSPPLMAALFGIGGFIRRNKILGMVILGISLAWVIFYARWWAWHGDVCWGPRFIIPATGLLMLGLAEVFQTWPDHGLGKKALVLAALLLGPIVQLLAIPMAPEVYFSRTVPPDYSTQHLINFVPQLSPLVGQIKTVLTASQWDFALARTFAAEVLGIVVVISGGLLALGGFSRPK